MAVLELDLEWQLFLLVILVEQEQLWGGRRTCPARYVKAFQAAREAVVEVEMRVVIIVCVHQSLSQKIFAT